MSRTWRAIGRGELAIGRRLGVGTSPWTVRRPAVATPSESPVSTTPAAWAGYIVARDPAEIATAAPGSPAASAQWAGVAATSATALRTGDVLTGGGRSFVVEGPDGTASGYARYYLREQ